MQRPQLVSLSCTSDGALLMNTGWVVNKGRMKFCRPTYRGIFTQDPELAKKTFMKHKDFYVSISSLASGCILIVDSTQLLER